MDMKGHRSYSDKLGHFLPSQLACIHLLFWVLLSLSRSRLINGILPGTPATCTNEGEQVRNPLSDVSPCFTCYCKKSQIECVKDKCQSQGCYMMLADVKQNCCRVCKGCDYNNKTYSSGSQWTSPDDPCRMFQCQGGVVTISQQQCYCPCKTSKEPPKGQCCPPCDGCELSGMTFRDGDGFVLVKDQCVRCKRQNGSVVCAKQACPVLPCPPSKVVHKPNSCCPECRGHREFFEVKGCILSTFRVHGERFKVDNCTTCVCNKSTSICERKTCQPLPCSSEFQVVPNGECCPQCVVSHELKSTSICERVTCQPLPCNSESQVVPDGECCPQCGRERVFSSCVVAGQKYKEGETWKRNPCTTCECLKGKPLCVIDQCNPNLVCPAGYKIESAPGDCCPKCVKAFAVCTIFGDPHYRTFDRRIFSFQGSCKYVLSEDCVSRSFSIRVKNDARQSQSFSWTKSIFIKVNKTKIVLLQQSKIKVDGKVVNPPFTKPGILTITREEYSITVATNFGMSILWNGDSFVEVKVPPVFQGQLCGLCGNYNGDGSDDFKTRKGRIVPNALSFSRSWRVGGKRFCDRPDSGPSVEPICRSDADSPGRQKCELLKGSAFQPCHQSIGVHLYLRSCILDMCECPANRQCYCDALMAYAHECARSGVVLNWRTATNCTGPPCHGGMVFTACGPPCPLTCDDPFVPVVNVTSTGPCSTSTCVSGCFCPTGTVLHRNRCIKPEKCPSSVKQ